MKTEGLSARKKRKFKSTTDSRFTQRIARNLLSRDFTTDAPNKVWVTDVTGFWTDAGRCFLAAILDLFSRRVVGWEMSEHNDTDLALSAFRKAIESRRPTSSFVHHSDRGSPYGSDAYIDALDAQGAVRSMSRKGDCWDNAVAESFFATLEHELRSKHTFSTPADARNAVEQNIEGFYNPQRIHSTLGNLSPIEFELGFANPPTTFIM